MRKPKLTKSLETVHTGTGSRKMYVVKMDNLNMREFATKKQANSFIRKLRNRL